MLSRVRQRVVTDFGCKPYEIVMFRPGPPRDEMELPARFRFGEFEVDLAAMQVLRGENALRLEPRAFDLLLLLAANPGRVVEKEEIFERLWEASFVSDNALTRVVAALRHELGDDARQPTIIETVWKRGYRFLPSIEPERASTVDETADVTVVNPEQPVPLRPPHRWLIAALIAILAASGIWLSGWFWRRSQFESTRSVPLTPVQFTSEPGTFLSPEFSPDGTQLAFASDIAGGLEIFVQPIHEGRARRLTHCGVCVEPAWSPDGQWIAFTNRGQGGIWLVSPNGNVTRQLTEFGSQPAWAPDSKTVVFAQPGSPVTGSLQWAAIDGSILWTVDVGSGSTRQLTRTMPGGAGQGQPAFTADGKWVVFASGNFNSSKIWRVAVTGGEPEPLVSEEAPRVRRINQWHDPTPDPRGRGLYVIRRGVASTRIERLQFAHPDNTETLYAPAPSQLNGLTISHEGRYLAFAVEDAATSIEEADLDADAGVLGSPRALSSPPIERVMMPLYSPDGAFLLFSRWRVGTDPDAVIVNREGEEIRVISSLPIFAPQWVSPTDVVLAPGQSTARVNVVTGHTEPVPMVPGTEKALAGSTKGETTWSTDLQRAVTSASSGEAREIFAWRSGEAEARQLTHMGGTAVFPQYSRDDRWVIFQHTAPGGSGNELWRISPDGGEPQRLLSGDGPSWAGQRSTHGDLVVYAASRHGVWYLAVASPDRRETLLAIPSETAGYLRWPTWSPDGKRIAYERNHYNSRIWIVDLRPSPHAD